MQGEADLAVGQQRSGEAEQEWSSRAGVGQQLPCADSALGLPVVPVSLHWNAEEQVTGDSCQGRAGSGGATLSLSPLLKGDTG